ncbi:MAG: hypothetical protein AB1295_01260 [Candidatus Micrarchaeota archaeon]
MMERTAKKDLPSVNASVQRARLFYGRCKADAYYDHSRRVLTRARAAGIVEGTVILDPKQDEERRRANHVLTELCLYHPVSPAMFGSRPHPELPLALRDKEILKELEIFGGLTMLDQTGSPTTCYSSLLNGGGRPPLALLVKLADYAVTHDTEDMIGGLIDPGQASIFRAYASRAHAYDSMKNEARAGEAIWAPMAELFGYPSLAGKIMGHAYRINHPDIYAHITSTMADELFQTRLAFTQGMMKEMARVIKANLRAYGFDADVTLRLQKSEGKIMRKVFRMINSDLWRGFEDMERQNRHARYLGKEEPHKQIPEPTAERISEHVRASIKGFDFTRLSDWVAGRVVLKRFRGKRLEGSDGTEFYLAETIITQSIEMQRIMLQGLEFTKEVHRGNYNAYHFDMYDGAPEKREAAKRPLRTEWQLKTEEWHRVAEQGQAAHYYYLGGDREFIDQIRQRYYEIIHGHNGRH